MADEIKPAQIDRTIACRACRRFAEGEETLTVTRAFRTPLQAGGGIATVSWTEGLTVRVVLSPPGVDEGGDWHYPTHAYIEHPDARNAYALVCANERRLGRSE